MGDIMQLRVVFFCALLITLSDVTVAQKATVLNVPAPRTPANSGKQMFEAYCAACHGKGGKGDGPVAAALKVPPPDLTGLTGRNDGKFPWLQVSKTITGQAGTPAHGSREMPIWGPVFMSMSHQHESEVRLRVANLADYIKSFQQK
jgi:mono/diheme cytochrome c family protein